jgi:hypothetical protein
MSPIIESPDLRAAIERRVSRLESEMSDMRGQMLQALTRIDATLTATLPTLATNAQVAALEATLTTAPPTLATKAELATKPSHAYLWGAIGTLLTLSPSASSPPLSCSSSRPPAREWRGASPAPCPRVRRWTARQLSAGRKATRDPSGSRLAGTESGQVLRVEKTTGASCGSAAHSLQLFAQRSSKYCSGCSPCSPGLQRRRRYQAGRRWVIQICERCWRG